MTVRGSSIFEWLTFKLWEEGGERFGGLLGSIFDHVDGGKTEAALQPCGTCATAPK